MGVLQGIMERYECVVHHYGTFTEHCRTLLNIAEALWGVAEHYGTLQSIVGLYGTLPKHCGIVMGCCALQNIMERCMMLQDVTEHYRSVADCYGALMERYGTDTKDINFAHH